MSIRMAPPGRTSNSQIGFVNPFGPHHCATCVGSAHAAHTSSRGASMVRVRTSSDDTSAEVVKLKDRFPAGPVLRLFAGMFLLLDLKFAKVVLQAIDALVPEPAVLLHPVGDL